MSSLSQQALDLRQQMEQIRCDLAGNVLELTDDAKTLTDYRYHVRKHPWAALSLAAAAGFVLMPSRSRKQATDRKSIEGLVKDSQLVVQSKTEIAQKRGLLATGVSLLAAAAVRAGMAYAQQQAAARLSAFAQARHQMPQDHLEPRASYPTYPR